MIGVGPDEVDKISIWQFQAMVEGYRRAHQTEEEAAQELSVEEFDDLANWVGA